MITYAQERLANIKPEIEGLVASQWLEMAKGFEAFIESPNWEWYLSLEAKGNLMLLTARDQGVLLGYFGAYVYRSTTSKNLMVQATPYYVVPHKFRAIILKRLIQNLLTAVPTSVGTAMITIKTHTWASAGPILEHLGFRAVETWYMLEAPVPPPEAGKEPA